jgi:protein-S-isoprenylcysteine O-methyltransferase Ste14
MLCIILSWGSLDIVWIVLGVRFIREPRLRRRRLHWRREIRLLLTILAVAIAILASVPMEFWHWSTVESVRIKAIGVPITVSTAIWTIWARSTLGEVWKPAATEDVPQRLVTNGPYKVVRHPIYAGFIGMLAGTALLLGLGRWVLLPLFGCLLMVFRSGAEEKSLRNALGKDYEQYAASVPKFIPRH